MNREHRSFSGIYFIAKLKTNILNIVQLDEIGYEIHINAGVMCIKDVERNLLAKIPHALNRLYVLNTNNIWYVSQHAEEKMCRHGMHAWVT
jgi:hypothetical protein